MSETGTVAQPLRYKPKEAAALLGLDVQTLYKLLRGGVFTAVRPHGRGPGRPIYLVPAEIQAYATGGPAAVLALKRKKPGSS